MNAIYARIVYSEKPHKINGDEQNHQHKINEDGQNVSYLPPTLRMTALKILSSDNLTIAFLITDRTESLSSVFRVIKLLYA
jgi:hypothetical protein